MASVHPVITSYSNASNEASWLTTAFMITNTRFQPLWRRRSDMVGRKSVCVVVLSIFALTNLCCALSQSIGSFIAAKAVCGIGAGGTMSMALVVVNDLVKVEYRGTYISHINVAFGIGAACGAAFGGVVSDSIGWRWTFGFQVPVSALCMIAVFFTVPDGLGLMLAAQATNKKGDNPAWAAIKNFDSLGLVLLVLAVACFILFFNMGGNELPWKHPLIITFIVLAVVLAGMCLFVEKRAKQPIMPLHLLVTHPYANLTYANFLAGIASNTVLFNAPLWSKAVELHIPSASGLRLTAPSISGAIAGVATGYIITYTRRLKPMLVVGAVVYLAGSIAVFFMDRRLNEAAQVALITPTPLSQGFIYLSSMMAAFATSPQEQQDMITTTLSLWRNLGIVVGVSVSSLVFQNMLNVYLDKEVVGPEAQRWIEIARGSVRSVRSVVSMPDPYQSQGKFSRAEFRDAYTQVLKLSSITAIVAIMLPIKLSKMKKGESVDVPGGE
ncbi:Vacuolar basic amino acid transporter 2 [Fulvia fulva]|nr:Vacuolar basic amino acid transporter 2 [Fulvia fulva]WPV21724.1 Vacuolar basic amino acid transporter 2 [Fulvia fulva]WPV36959.1 Vacuolar basic amino acid transporter 2 [Fulvia fulva]